MDCSKFTDGPVHDKNSEGKGVNAIILSFNELSKNNESDPM